MPEQTLTEAQLRERGLAGLAELARLDERTGSINAVAARSLDLVGSMLDADRAAVCAIEGDETIEWLAQRRLERLIAASSDLRPSELSWVRRPLETGRPEVFDRRIPEHERSALYEKAVELRPELRGRAMIMTGDTLNPTLVAFAEDNGLRLLAKPFDIDDLVAAVADELGAGAAG